MLFFFPIWFKYVPVALKNTQENFGPQEKVEMTAPGSGWQICHGSVSGIAKSACQVSFGLQVSGRMWDCSALGTHCFEAPFGTNMCRGHRIPKMVTFSAIGVVTSQFLTTTNMPCSVLPSQCSLASEFKELRIYHNVCSGHSKFEDNFYVNMDRKWTLNWWFSFNQSFLQF